MNVKCEFCQKNYASYKTLWYHKKTKHDIPIDTDNIVADKIITVVENKNTNTDTDKKDNKFVVENKNVTDINKNDNDINKNVIDKKDNNKDDYRCEFCLKTYKTRQSKSRHKKTCSVKKGGATNVQEINNLINDLQTKIKDLEKNNGAKNIININNGTINNQTNNKIIINKIGEENPFELKLNQIQKVLSQELLSIITLIEYLNFNEQLPSNHNFLTSSLESNYLTIYNSDENTFEKQRKKYVFDEVMESSISKIEKLYDVFKKDFPLERQYEFKNNIDTLKQIHQAGYSNKLLKELNKQLNLLSYNKKHIVEKTWSRLRNDPIDEEEDKKYWLELANDKPESESEFKSKQDTEYKSNQDTEYNHNQDTDSEFKHNYEPEFKFINDDSDIEI